MKRMFIAILLTVMPLILYLNLYQKTTTYEPFTITSLLEFIERFPQLDLFEKFQDFKVASESIIKAFDFGNTFNLQTILNILIAFWNTIKAILFFLVATVSDIVDIIFWFLGLTGYRVF